MSDRDTGDKQGAEPPTSLVVTKRGETSNFERTRNSYNDKGFLRSSLFGSQNKNK